MLSFNAPVAVPMTPTSETIVALAPSSAIKSINSSTTHTRSLPPHKFHHIWLVTGPAGCGKSTIAAHISETLSFTYIEGDDFHPVSNVEKMSAGIPLTDADRWDWLTALRDESMHRIDEGADGVVLTCSALKRKYRDVIRVAGYFNHNLHIHFIYLDAPEEVLMARVAGRANHFMPADLVRSQFEALERPGANEPDVITVDVSRPIDKVKNDSVEAVISRMD